MKKLILLAGLMGPNILQGWSPVAAQAAEGKRVFETSCAVGYCHGLDGRAGKGPRLRDRVWSRSYLYKTIAEGIPGSSMPAWGGKLSDEKIAAVISYIFTISQEAPSVANRAEPTKTNLSGAKTEPVGNALFFDLTRDRNCGVCHRMGDRGSDVGPALTGLNMTEQTLLSKIKSQPVSENNVRVKAGAEDFCGVKVSDDADSVRLYDVEGLGPPVLRTIPRNTMVVLKPCPSLNVHADNSKTYSADELSAVVTFLSHHSAH